MRAANTYRSERRNDWRNYHRLYRGLAGAIETWPAFNAQVYGTSGYGIWRRVVAPTFNSRGPRSKYMPHNGKREMERRRSRHAA